MCVFLLPVYRRQQAILSANDNISSPFIKDGYLFSSSFSHVSTFYVCLPSPSPFSSFLPHASTLLSPTSPSPSFSSLTPTPSPSNSISPISSKPCILA